MSAALFIKPRWLAAESADAEIAAHLSAHPADHVTILAEAGYAPATGERVALPQIGAISRRELLRQILRLRRTRYDEAVILAEESRDEMGYGEAKFWAFAARARRRSLGRLRHLSLRDEMLDKWRRIILQRIARTSIRLLGRLRGHHNAPCAEREKCRLAAFIVLHQFDRMFGKQRGRLTWVAGAEDEADLARQIGWTVNAPGAQAEASLLLLMAISTGQRMDTAAVLRQASGALASRGVVLLRTQAAEEEVRNVAGTAGFEVVQYSASRITDNEADVWLRKAPGE